MKYLKKFGSETEYNTYISGSEVFLPNVSLIGVDDVRYNPIPPPPIISAGMICYADSSNNLKFCARDEWSSSLGEVQGVVVVPSNHTIDGTARIMCIKGITTAGTESSSDVNMAWGPTGDTGLPNMDKVPTWDNTIGGAIGNNVLGYLPSDSSRFTGATCATDSIAKYYGDTFTPYIPSPYLEDGSQNPAYINTIEATTANCLSDFNGKGNTAVLVGLGSAYLPANACNQYGTTALPSGNWYLPAMGELGYMMVRFNEINNALNAVGGVQLDSTSRYCSSTEYNIYNFRGVGSFCDVAPFDKENNSYVRAFASVNISRLSF